MAKTNVAVNLSVDMSVNVSKEADRDVTVNQKIDYDNPPAGKLYYPVPLADLDCEMKGFDPEIDLHVEDGSQLAWRRFSATKVLCKMELVDEEYAPFVEEQIRSIKTACKRLERSKRCKVRSEKTGKKIVCPESCKCGTDSCPRKHQMLADAETSSPISYEQYEEDNGNEPVFGDPVSMDVVTKLDRELFCKRLKDKNPALERMFLLQEEGYDRDEIQIMLKIQKTRYYDMRSEIKSILKKYFPEYIKR